MEWRINVKSIISLMSDIEKEADEIVQNATNKKSELYKNLEEKMIAIDDNYKNKLTSEIDKLNCKCTSAYNNEIDKVRVSTQKKIKELDDMYKQKYEKYLNSLFKRIIGM